MTSKQQMTPKQQAKLEKASQLAKSVDKRLDRIDTLIAEAAEEMKAK